jgi:hypothetical protein
MWDFGCWILDVGFRMLDLGSWMWEVGFGMLDLGLPKPINP